MLSVNEMHFVYDNDSRPAIVKLNGTMYFYRHNLQGDIVGIVDENGSPVVEYKYNAWGKLLAATGTLKDTLGKLNPFRYRGYVYDEETELYYAQSRYYNPEISRWINADDTAYLGADGNQVGYNLFSYCANNSVNKEDKSGKFGIAIGLFIGASSVIGGLAGAFTAACTGGNVIEGLIEGIVLGAVAATATIVVPLAIPTANAAVMVGVTYAAAGTSGMIVDAATQRISHELGETAQEEFTLDKGRMIKTGITTGISGVIPTYGNPGKSVLDATGSVIIGFDAAFFNAGAEIVLTQFLK